MRKPFSLLTVLLFLAGMVRAQGLAVPGAVCEAEVRGMVGAACLSAGGVSAGDVSAEAFMRWRGGERAYRFGQAEGIGHVYLTDPMHGAVAEVTLPRLHGDGTVLDGQYVRVRSDRLNPDGQPLAGHDGTADFRFAPNLDPAADCLGVLDDCAPFDAVNVYYHIDRYAHDFWGARMGVEIDWQAEAVVHISGEGGFADGARRLFKLAVGDLFMKNAALEDDLIYHEYTHLVTYELGFRVDTTSPSETRAINEALADYFTAAFTDDARIGEWVATCPDRGACLGPENDTDLRVLTTDPARWNWNAGTPDATLKYGVCTRFHAGDGKCKTSWLNFDDQYVWSMMWSGALWELRRRLGPDLADGLVLDALRRNPATDLRFADALAALFATDADLYGGAHAATIEAVFAERGFTDGIVATEAGPGGASGLVLHPNAPNPFAAVTEVRFTLGQPGPVAVAVYDVLGRRVVRLAEGRFPAGTHRLRWDAAGQPSGLYLAVLVTATGTHTRRMVLLR